MVVLQHAALHAQERQIVWQQILMRVKEYVWPFPMSNPPVHQKMNQSQPKNRCSARAAYCGFFVAVAAFGVARLDAPTGSLVSSVDAFMASRLGEPFSEYALPCAWILS